MSKWKAFYGVTLFLGLISAILEVSLYRQTIISVSIPLSIIVLIGITAFIFNRKHYSKTYSTSGFFFPLFQNIVSWGFLASYLFIALNFYLAPEKTTDHKFKIQAKDSMPASGRSAKRVPLVDIDYFGFKKELVFGYKDTEEINKSDSVLVTSKKGALGFDVIRSYSVFK
jgi:hypothetical protein